MNEIDFPWKIYLSFGFNEIRISVCMRCQYESLYKLQNAIVHLIQVKRMKRDFRIVNESKDSTFELLWLIQLIHKNENYSIHWFIRTRILLNIHTNTFILFPSSVIN